VDPDQFPDRKTVRHPADVPAFSAVFNVAAKEQCDEETDYVLRGWSEAGIKYDPCKWGELY